MRTCPICKTHEPAPDYAPFCSKRCADVDLQRWFVGAYTVPGEPAETPSVAADPDGEA